MRLFNKYLIFLLLPTILVACSNQQFTKNASHLQVDNASIQKGKELAEKYCQSCHLLPDPSLLDAAHWDTGVLPAMGPRLGIFSFKGKKYSSSKYDLNIPRNFYPQKPVASEEEWQNIIDYFTSVSPDRLPEAKRQYKVQPDDKIFFAESPPVYSAVPAVTYVHVDSSFGAPQIFVSDIYTKNLSRFTNQFHVIDTFFTPTPVVDVDINRREFVICNIGLLSPNNGKYGFLQSVQLNEKKRMKQDTVIGAINLYRPVQVCSADLNADGKIDYLVCEFGNLEGALSWMENKGGQYVRHVLRALPGAIKAYIRDVNKDGLPDIWALFSQGEEGIFLFTNKGNGQFQEEELLRFPSIYGSSYFELADFNKDGFQDIVYTCGDNADFSAVLKPYHGIYIFLNDGTNHFKQQFFFPMNGCFKAMARDFDADGDLDIAAISFFADYQRHPEEGFIYLENKGKFDFTAFSIPGTENGRWLTMDAGDIDGDQKPDILLGNFSVAPSFIKNKVDWKNGPAVMLLRNTMGKN